MEKEVGWYAGLKCPQLILDCRDGPTETLSLAKLTKTSPLCSHLLKSVSSSFNSVTKEKKKKLLSWQMMLLNVDRNYSNCMGDINLVT